MMKTKVFQLLYQVNKNPVLPKKLLINLKKFLELKPKNDIELHVKQVERRGRLLKKTGLYPV